MPEPVFVSAGGRGGDGGCWKRSGGVAVTAAL
jgi:hypothetical protein